MAEKLSLWTIYDHPSDYPNRVVARRWELNVPTGEVLLFADVESAHAEFRGRGLYFLVRHRVDDPTIVGTWV